MHLGRRPSRLPEVLEGSHGIRLASLDPRAAWADVVARAVEQQVDAVLLAGDVVDSSNHFMEAYGALYTGVERLTNAGIDVIAVAGNHDVKALPRLADELKDFVLLGRGGVWESHVIRRAGEPVARVIGWSFPRTHVDTSPLDSLPDSYGAGRYDDDAPDDLRTVGLLHCDLDASDKRYAPVSSRAFEQLRGSVSAWFLGHVHQPSIRSGGRPVGYLGSLVGLDSGELDARGPWLARSTPSNWELEHIPLSPVMWKSVDVDVSASVNAEELQATCPRAIHDLANRLAPKLDGTKAVGVRIQFVGRTSLSNAQLQFAAQSAREQLSIKIEGVVYFVDKVSDHTRPALDLEMLAQRNDPLAIIARRLIDLQEGGAACAQLVAAARPRFDAVAAHANFSQLSDGPPNDASIRHLLQRMAARALEQLLTQKGISAPSPLAEEARV